MDDAAYQFLSRAGIEGRVAADVLSGGKNNKVFRILRDDGSAVIMKAYFHHPNDPRDRLAHEFSFSTYAWNAGLRCLPEPLAQDRDHHYGLYEYVPGRRLEKAEITWEVVESAAQFICGLNQDRKGSEAMALPAGSEACFSIGDHLNTVERRVQLLAGAGRSGNLPAAARAFVGERLLPEWNSLRAKIESRCGQEKIGLEDRLHRDDRFLSPSDFGYHNAICRDGETAPGTRICYHDFEYAGWDDPAKLFGDFFNQPEVPVPEAFYEAFVERCLSLSKSPALQFARARLLHPAYTVKWVCIILNALIPDGRARRDFAGHESADPERANRQVARATATLDRLNRKTV